MKTWIVIPTYNEKENIPILLDGLIDLGITDLHILFVDDGSPDGTGQVIEDLKARFKGKIDCIHRAGKLGLGSAYLEGFCFALEHGADFVGQMDADFSHPMEKIPMMISALTYCDVVIGSRYVPGGSLDERWSAFRKLLSGFGNFYARTILGMKIRDVTGGFKFWKADMLRNMPLERVKSNGYVFQVEMNYLAGKLGCQFQEVPIHFAERTRGISKMSFRIQAEAAWQVWLLHGRYRDL